MPDRPWFLDQAREAWKILSSHPLADQWERAAWQEVVEATDWYESALASMPLPGPELDADGIKPVVTGEDMGISAESLSAPSVTHVVKAQDPARQAELIERDRAQHAELLARLDPWKTSYPRCRFQTEWRGCNLEQGHAGAHHDPDSKIDWTGGMVWE